VAQFTRFKPARDAMLFGWAVLGEDFLEDITTPATPGGGGYGEPMSEVFFQRYKPTLRKQKG